MRHLVSADQALLSVQCLAEFYSTVTGKLTYPLSPGLAQRQVQRYMTVCEVVAVTPAVLLEGIRGTLRHGISFWDGLIWAAATLNQVPIVLTEDQQHGRVIEGVRYLNPFDPTFDLSMLEEVA